MAKLTLAALTSLTNQASAISTINANMVLIEALMELLVSRDGTAPNTMTADLDLNSNKLLNVAAGTNAGDGVRFSQLTSAVGQATGTSMKWDTGTSDADPGAGNIRGDNATVASITNLFIDDVDDGAGADISTFIQTWDNSSNSSSRGYIRLVQKVDGDNYLEFEITGAVTNASGYTKIPVSHSQTGGTLANADEISMHFSRTGDKGATGSTGSTGSTGPAGPMASVTGGTGITDSGTSTDAILDLDAATATTSGGVELLTDAEMVTGSDTTRAGTAANMVAKMAAPGAIGGTTAAAITGTTLKGGTSLEIASGAIVTGIADEDDMTSNSATLLSTQQAIKAYVDAAGGGGKVLQVVSSEIALASGSTNIPNDDTAPLITEGTEIESLLITPASSSNTILLSAAMTVFADIAGAIVSVWRGTTLIGVGKIGRTANLGGTISFVINDPPATTSEIDYSIRIGRATTGSWWVGQFQSPDFGGVMASNSLVLQEIDGT